MNTVLKFKVKYEKKFTNSRVFIKNNDYLYKNSYD